MCGRILARLLQVRNGIEEWSIWSVLYIWSVWFNKIDETDQPALCSLDRSHGSLILAVL